MLDVKALIESGGLLLITAIVFAESGLLLGFFLPGDTLLFSAGFFASQGKLPLGWLILLIVAAAVAGYYSGYRIGRKFGPHLFSKPNGILFRREYLERSEAFYKKHGGKTIFLSRFIPVVRTFAPVVAGMGRMPLGKFNKFNIMGAAVWGAGVTLLGAWLGSRIPNVDRYLLPVILFAMAISFGPSAYHLVKLYLNKAEKTR